MLRHDLPAKASQAAALVIVEMSGERRMRFGRQQGTRDARWQPFGEHLQQFDLPRLLPEAQVWFLYPLG